MKLPGATLLRDRGAVRDFERLEPARRELVFYSEGLGDWPHMGPVIHELLRTTDRPLAYLTSDPNDPGLALDDPRVRAFDIGSGTARTILFARMDCHHFVMTLPDLGNLWLKRSVHPVHYVYLFHSFNSTHTSYRKGAFDQFDTVLCVGPHHVEEIRRTEAAYSLRGKELVEHGSAKLDTLLTEVEAIPRQRDASGARRVLVAPTWGESSLIEGDLGVGVIDQLLTGGFQVVLRLHPMTVRRLPELVRDLQRRYGGEPRFMVERDMSATRSWLESDLMVSDWSGAATEYAFATGKPVAYIATPPKIMNPEWERIGLPAFEDRIRHSLGRVVEPAEVSMLSAVISELLAGADGARDRALELRERSVFNVGGSSPVAARFLADLGSSA